MDGRAQRGWRIGRSLDAEQLRTAEALIDGLLVEISPPSRRRRRLGEIGEGREGGSLGGGGTEILGLRECPEDLCDGEFDEKVWVGPDEGGAEALFAARLDEGDGCHDPAGGELGLDG